MNNFPLKIVKTGFSACTKDWTTYHEITVPFFRVYYVESGSASVKIESESYKLLPGNIYFIPGIYPFLNECKREMKVYWLHALPLDPRLERIIDGIREVRQWPFDVFDFHRELILSLGTFDPDKSYTKHLELQAFLSCVTARLASLNTGPSGFAQFPSSIRKATEYMDSHYKENPPLSKIAVAACLAPVYFHRLFRKHYGTTPHAYMEKKRMQTAQLLLASTDKTLEEIAEASGYENAFYFSKVFKKHFKTSPGKARKLSNRP